MGAAMDHAHPDVDAVFAPRLQSSRRSKRWSESNFDHVDRRVGRGWDTLGRRRGGASSTWRRAIRRRVYLSLASSSGRLPAVWLRLVEVG